MTAETIAPSQARNSAARSDYRAFMTCKAEDGLIDVARDQLATWIRNKKSWDVDVTADGHHQDGDRQLDVRYGTTRGRSLRARLVETGTPSGTWTTELLAHDQPGDGDWLSLTVENDQGHFADVPKLARYLMDALELRDGSLHFVDRPHIFYEHRIDVLINVLCDEERHGLLFVAGTDDRLPFQPFVDKVRDWTRQVYGLAQVVVLDPPATRALQEEFGTPHAATPWTVRTYQPGVDPASTIDAWRHRTLGTGRLANMSDGGVRLLLGRAARTHAAERRPLPQIQRLRRHFERLDNQAIVAAIADLDSVTEASATVTPAPAPLTSPPPNAVQDLGRQAESYLAEIDLVKSILGVPSLDEATLRGIASRASAVRTDPDAVSRAAEQIKAQQSRIEGLEDELAFVRELSEDDELQHALLQKELDDTRAEVRWLRHRLQAAGDFTSAHNPAPGGWTTEYPEDFDTLLERLSDLEGRVLFTGNRDTTLDLDEHDTLQSAVRTTWEACLALSDYVRAREAGLCDKGVDHYLRNTPTDFRSMSPGKHAVTETAVTMRQHGHERVFPVPTEVEESGWASMTAHFKLARIGMVSPRLYYLDDFVRTGRIYMGYIGPHLTNTQTN